MREAATREHHGVDARVAGLFLVIATLAMISDGYDLAVMGLIAPELIKTWHVAPADLVPALSAGVIGLLVGAPTLGYVGDRIGRKRAMLICLVAMGVFSLINAFAGNLTHFVVLRFLTGVGLGGLSPVLMAAAAETAPRRFRGLFIVVVNFGVPAGFAVPGWTTALLVPRFGWTALLVVGGVLPLVIAVLCQLFVREPKVAPIEECNMLMRPDSASRWRALFAGRFAVITPVCWLLLSANQFTNFFTLSWLPTLLQMAGLPTGQAGVDASFYAIGGIAGGVLLTLLIDRLGAVPLIVLFSLGAPAVAAIGVVDPASLSLIAAVAAAGFCVTGNNFATNAVLGMIYRVRIRALGMGTAHAAGRLGSLAAQIVGGLLFAWHLKMADMYMIPGAVLLIGAVASVVLVVLCRREFGNHRLDAVETTYGSTPGDTVLAKGQPLPG